MFGHFFSLKLNNVLRCRQYISSILKRLFHSLLFSYSYECSGADVEELVIFNTVKLKNRSDYEEYINNFLTECQKQRVVQEITIKYIFKPSRLIAKVAFVIANTGKAYSFKDLIQLSQLYELYIFLNTLKLKNRKIVTFCDAHPEDNLISQVCKKYFTCQTYTLQHGYYVSAPGSINQEVYQNFISDYMLCWGDISKENLILNGVSAQRLLSFGCFKNKLSIQKKQVRTQNVFILLNGRHNSESNKSLLNLAEGIIKNTSFNVLIKKHPDDQSQYAESDRLCFISDLTTGLELSDVAVISESGVFIDLYLAKFPCLILKTNKTKPEYLSLPNLATQPAIISMLNDIHTEFIHTKIDSLIQEHIDFSVI